MSESGVGRGRTGGKAKPARRSPRPAARTARRPDAASALNERVKELTCLYAIAQIANSVATPLPRALQSVVEMLPSAWQHPDRAWASIALDASEFSSPGGRAAGPRQSSPIVVRGTRRGVVQVGYRTPAAGGAPCALLDEEQRLLEEVARQISVLVERSEARAKQDALQTRLRHADRLATIGQFAAGVAHEISEPLGSILGFAQLIGKTPRLSRQVRNDLARIQSAALHAREIIRKLVTFARQTPPRFASVDLNRLIEESASLWVLRCEDNGIRVLFDLAPGLPPVMADEAQIRQVVTNLAVNAAQAMQEGGQLRIATTCRDGMAEMAVSDTGMGIPEGILGRIFDPFFTTKDVDEGTGLGLSVVHGIVEAHGGRIEVDSHAEQGTAVRVHLPLQRPVNDPPPWKG